MNIAEMVVCELRERGPSWCANDCLRRDICEAEDLFCLDVIEQTLEYGKNYRKEKCIKKGSK